uniref:Transthyretin-like family protein n=1 Tax=Syphacia muris TaxID=451379 RepID=A0A0N5ATL4_9BILA
MLHILIATLLFGICQSFRTQSAGVRGTLLCGDKPLVGVKVKLWDDDSDHFLISGPDLDDLLQEGTTNGQGKFELSGYTSEMTTIDPVLKVYHDCNDGLPCQRKVEFIIPDKYVTNGPVPEKFFDIGIVNMEAKFSGETRDCLNRK